MLPISFTDVERARARLQPYLTPTAFRSYGELDAWVGHGIRVWVKHENHNPTNAFKVRNALSAMTALTPEERKRGVVAATRGNHGLGLAYAGALLGIPVTVCVPLGNNPEKNAGMRALGARLVEKGRDYDEAIAVAEELVRREGLRLVHSTNNKDVIAGAATLTLEMLETSPDLDAVVFALGGGSLAVGALTVAQAKKPSLCVYAAQAEGASATHDSWKLGRAIRKETAETFADGVATRSVYDLTFPALQKGLKDFVTVSEKEIAESLRVLLRTTHNLVEGAGAVGLAGLVRLREALSGKKVGVVISGGNIEQETLRRVLGREI